MGWKEVLNFLFIYSLFSGKKTITMSDNNNKPTYEIHYGNGLKQGIDEATAVTDLAELLKLSEEAAAGIIQRTGRILKSGLDERQAERYRSLLDEVGLQVKIREVRAPASGSAEESTQLMQAVSPPPVEPPPPAPPGDDGTAPATDGEPREHAVLFHGRGFEYFKIWIVNILLTILTLGIYSAWAKVRNKQYFYGNTEIDGNSFQYTAKPIQILKGRIIAFVLFLIYLGVTQLFPPAGPVFAILFLIFLPWIVIRSLAFNARNSVYRGVRFRFEGGVGGAVMAFIVWPILSAISFGLLLPFTWQRQAAYTIGNHAYGTTPLEFNADVGRYYGLLGKLMLTGFLVMLALLAVVAAGANGANEGEPGVLFSVIPMVLMVFMVAFYVVLYALVQANLGNLKFNHTHLGDIRFTSVLTLRGMAALYVVNTLAIVFTLGLMIPWAKVRTAAYRARCLTLTAPSLDGFVAAETEAVSALGEQVGEIFDMDIGAL